MKDYASKNIRNVGIVGHGGCGKTTLAEAMLFAAGGTTRMGKVEEGSTKSDYTQAEIDRQISISASMLHCEWQDHKINIMDTPGYADFTGEVKGALRAVDNAVVLLRSVEGIEVGTEVDWGYAAEYDIPRLLFVTKMGNEHADFDKVCAMVQDRFGEGAIPFQFPVNQGEGFNAIVDLLRMKQLVYEPGSKAKPRQEEIPPELMERAGKWREVLVERVAESDDELLEKYLEEGELSREEIEVGLRKGVVERGIFPILCGDGAQNVGMDRLLDAIRDFLASPADRTHVTGTRPGREEEIQVETSPDAPLSALVFKTISEAHVGELSLFRVYSGVLRSGDEVLNATKGVSERIGQIYFLSGHDRAEIGTVMSGDMGALVKLRDTHTGDTLCSRQNPIVLPPPKFPEPVIRIAISPKAKGDEDKINMGLARLHEEDPTFLFEVDGELKQTLISGQGELHLEIVVAKLKNKFGVDVDLIEPRIPYRETLLGTAESQHRYKKQTGGRGQYGEVYLRLEPLPRGGGFEFVDAITGGVIPSKFIPAVEKGLRETIVGGVVAGYPVMDVRVTVYDGSYHSVDSSELAFKLASSMAFKEGFMSARPILLEPIYSVEVTVPEEFMGDVMGDLSSRRGKIQGMESNGPFQVIRAQVPLAEMYRYSTTLRSLTQGRGIHTRSFSHYEQVPHDIAQKVIEEAKAREE